MFCHRKMGCASLTSHNPPQTGMCCDDASGGIVHLDRNRWVCRHAAVSPVAPSPPSWLSKMISWLLTVTWALLLLPLSLSNGSNAFSFAYLLNLAQAVWSSQLSIFYLDLGIIVHCWDGDPGFLQNQLLPWFLLWSWGFLSRFALHTSIVPLQFETRFPSCCVWNLRSPLIRSVVMFSSTGSGTNVSPVPPTEHCASASFSLAAACPSFLCGGGGCQMCLLWQTVRSQLAMHLWQQREQQITQNNMINDVSSP